MRIITNKPDPTGFAAGYGLELNSVSHGGIGPVAEGFLNLPMSDRAAIRLVAWNKHDAGYIDNVYGTRTFPSWDADSGGNGTIDNAGRARKDYNEVDTTGARLALIPDMGHDLVPVGHPEIVRRVLGVLLPFLPSAATPSA